MPTKQEKINKVITELFLELIMQDFDYNNIDTKNADKPVERYYILNRQKLTEIIHRGLGFVDRRTVYSMIHYLLGQGFIFHNSTSQISSHKEVIMPTNDTKYELNHDYIIEEHEKSFVHPHTLDQFTDKTSNQPVRAVVPINKRSIPSGLDN
ncbi:MAG TPA: hypothetical protein VI864_06765 [Candidatus Bathyarchaeia archaeon]|nr:hypothetical protein [Candidatus Bathyarchaeia archaeon]